MALHYCEVETATITEIDGKLTTDSPEMTCVSRSAPTADYANLCGKPAVATNPATTYFNYAKWLCAGHYDEVCKHEEHLKQMNDACDYTNFSATEITAPDGD